MYIRGSCSPFGFVLAVTYLFNLFVAVRAEDLEHVWLAEDFLEYGVDHVVPVSDALLVVDFDGLLVALLLALLDPAGLAAIALIFERLGAFPTA